MAVAHYPTTRTESAVSRAYGLLYVAFVVIPLVAGVDKFFLALTNWPAYLAPQVPALLNMEPETIMKIVGGIEVLAACLVAIVPRIGGMVVGLWMLGIIANLVWLGSGYDVILRDFGLSMGAFALASLAIAREREVDGEPRFHPSQRA